MTPPHDTRTGCPTRNQHAPLTNGQEQRKANLRGGTSISCTARGTDSATSSPNLVTSEGEPTADALASFTPGFGTTGTTTTAGVVEAAAATSDPPLRQSRPYETLLAGSLEKFEDYHQGRGGGTGRSDVRPQTTGGDWKGSQKRRPLSSGPNSRSRFPGARGEDGRSVPRGGDGGGMENRWKEKGQQARPRTRPKTAGAGSGGVQGVLSRMEGYEEVSVHPYWGQAGC